MKRITMLMLLSCSQSGHLSSSQSTPVTTLICHHCLKATHSQGQSQAGACGWPKLCGRRCSREVLNMTVQLIPLMALSQPLHTVSVMLHHENLSRTGSAGSPDAVSVHSCISSSGAFCSSLLLCTCCRCMCPVLHVCY